VSQTEINLFRPEAPEGGYRPRALGFSIFTEADSLEELKTMIRDAVSCHFDAAEKPSINQLHTIKNGVIPAWKQNLAGSLCGPNRNLLLP
jgi:hypothetical protein